jgi:hypothetical protein
MCLCHYEKNNQSAPSIKSFCLLKLLDHVKAWIDGPVISNEEAAN